MNLNKAWFEQNSACSSQMMELVRHFPDGGEVNLANLKTAASCGLDLGWLADKLFPQCECEEFHACCSKERKDMYEQMRRILPEGQKRTKAVMEKYHSDLASVHSRYKARVANEFWRICQTLEEQ